MTVTFALEINVNKWNGHTSAISVQCLPISQNIEDMYGHNIVIYSITQNANIQ